MFQGCVSKTNCKFDNFRHSEPKKFTLTELYSTYSHRILAIVAIMNCAHYFKSWEHTKIKNIIFKNLPQIYIINIKQIYKLPPWDAFGHSLEKWPSSPHLKHPLPPDCRRSPPAPRPRLPRSPPRPENWTKMIKYLFLNRLILDHSSEISGLCLMKCPSEILLKFAIFLE